MKVKLTRFACFFVSASWRKEQKAFFYIDFNRDGSKQEKAARKELARLLTQEKKTSSKRVYHEDCEGAGFHWRVSQSILLKYADWLGLSSESIEEEIARHRREFMLPPAEPIVVNRLDIRDLKRPHIIGLQLSQSCEQLRRALDQWRENNWLPRDDWMAMNGYGAHITITRTMLQELLGWLSFVRPFGEMLAEAMADAKEAEERAKLWEAGAQERARQWEEESKRTYSYYERYYREYRPTYTPPMSALAEALRNLLPRPIYSNKRYRKSPLSYFIEATPS